ncbi:coiled-coil domain-containing protein 81-like [Sardina pilchardus]|uniref:coiled-coil domain-containing protein 81-like n=1 Tax=Sardina pilchardus TaxID=27697 RepID=UPI002E114B76
MQNGEVVRTISRQYSDLSAQDRDISHLLVFVPDAERYAFPTLFALSENDIESIWSNVSSFIERQMLCQKGVHIARLGTFTFSVQRMDVGRKHKMIQRPIFLLAEKFKLFTGLKQKMASPSAGEVPVVPLNFSALSADGPFERDVVERCVRESLMLLASMVAKRPAVLLSFYGIGLLSFRQGHVRMRFDQDFLTALDRAWGLGHNSNSRASSYTAHKCCPDRDHELAPLQPSRSSLDVRDQTSSSSSSEYKEDDGDRETKKADRTIFQSDRREILKLATVKGICLTEDLEVSPQVQTENRLKQGGDSEIKVDQESHFCEGSCQDMGKELCNLCRARAQRNVPAEHVSEERRRVEKEVVRLFMVDQEQFDQELMQREQAHKEQMKRRNERDAECNIEMAKAREREAQQRSKYFGSYIFRVRPGTPPPLLRNGPYLRELLDQVEDHGQQKALDQQTQDLMDRMGQMELADEILEQRHQQLQRKASVVRCYKRALDTQCNGSCTGLGCTTRSCAESPVFGRYDEVPSALAERRRRARELRQHQINAATLRRRDAHFSRILEQKREVDMLNRTRQEMRADHVTRLLKLRTMRGALEDLWARTVEAKRLREQEERSFMKSGGRLVLDQCLEHQRCEQCQRRLCFCGGTNLWKESRYIAGSRLMVPMYRGSSRRD